ncbi:hypothetical protein LTR37_020101 [Vermiconidia calcicola]|uniref:Uncharacterized protein n=1 Tax=Vermiconidia calcicola TaxID=1690605 RepID=A0ACC3ME10_9PEZI|nr:hypothetical protein LTR37_020101 [Vermiconidia calcicola]
MGQTSSQIAPTQAIERERSQNFASMAGKKRRNVGFANEEMEGRQSKRVRRDGDDSVKQRKALRGKPQHRRGTAIRPSLDAVVDTQATLLLESTSRELDGTTSQALRPDEEDQPAEEDHVVRTPQGEIPPTPTQSQIAEVPHAEHATIAGNGEAKDVASEGEPEHAQLSKDELDGAYVARPDSGNTKKQKRKKAKLAEAHHATTEQELVPATVPSEHVTPVHESSTKEYAAVSSNAEAIEIATVEADKKAERRREKKKRRSEARVARQSMQSSDALLQPEPDGSANQADAVGGAEAAPMTEPLNAEVDPPAEVTGSEPKRKKRKKNKNKSAEPVSTQYAEHEEPQAHESLEAQIHPEPGAPQRPAEAQQQQSNVAPKPKRRKRAAEAITQRHEPTPPVVAGSAPISSYEAPPRGLALTPPESPEENQVAQDTDFVPQHGDNGSEHEEDYDPHDREGHVEPSNQINGWLSSQEFPVPPEHEELVEGLPFEAVPPVNEEGEASKPTAALRKRKRQVSYQEAREDEFRDDNDAVQKILAESSRRRKRVSKHDSDDSDEYQNEQEPDAGLEHEPSPEPEPPAQPARRKTKELKNIAPPKLVGGSETDPVAMKKYQTADRGTKTGQWSSAEKELADEIFWNVCQVHEISGDILKMGMVDWANIGTFKIEVYEAFPQRSLAAIRKFCQRRFTPHQKGAWTEEEDQALRDMYARFPGNWISISDMTGRPAGACRDRWLNHLKDSEARETGPWSTEEEAKLMGVVDECFEVIKANCEEEDLIQTRDTLESMIDWATVSKKMEGKRNAKRCREKWNLLKSRRASSANAAQPPPVPLAGEPLSKKRRMVEAAYAKLESGDVFDALTDIYVTMSEAGTMDKEFCDESTFWSVVSKQRGNKSKFYGREHGGALRRRAYYGALEQYADRKSVKAAQGIARKAEAMLTRVKKVESKGKLTLTRAYRVDEYPGGQKKVFEPADMDLEKDEEELAERGTDEKIESWIAKQEAAKENSKKDLARKEKEAVSQKRAGQDDAPLRKRKRDDGEKPGKKKHRSAAYVVSSDDEAPAGEHVEVPETQKQLDNASEQAVAGAEDELWDVQSLKAGTPGLSPTAFMARCKTKAKKERRTRIQ